jgi:acetolactate synthase-1/2/3 large subunit
MGSGLPEAVGACLANDRKLTTCLIGDGSLMPNVQELQTIAHHNLPIKIFVINNCGYLSVRHTQDAFLDGRRVGTGDSEENDISWPRIEAVARCFGLPFLRISRRENAEKVISTALNLAGPVLCEVVCPKDQEMRWKQGYKQEGGRFVPQTLDCMEESS